jgi:serine/threonine protein kinase/tetratricopeptide (TPR) repeat protein
MSTAVNVPVFLETLQHSTLYDDAGFADLVRKVQGAGMDYADGPTLAQWLVQHGYLTRFQAEQMLSGKYKNFIINRKYLILEPLGSGGMGAVYRCRHLTLKKDVALKVLPPKLTSDPSALQRFLQEARALAALNHPNIVQAHDCDEVNGQVFLVMGYVEGINLQHLVEKTGPLPVPRAAYYLVQACSAMQHAHEGGWVHRDLKPSNLVIDRTDTVKILDLGLARMMSDPGEPINRQHEEESALGSPDYISPEQSLNRPDIDIRSDIYSLGATLHFLLAGRPPFDGLPLMQKLLAHQLQEPPDLRRVRTDVSAELAGFVKRMLAKAPERRFATPREVAAALHQWAAAYRPSPQAIPVMPVESPERLYTAVSSARRPAPPASSPAVQDPLFPTPPSSAPMQTVNDPLPFTLPHGVYAPPPQSYAPQHVEPAQEAPEVDAGEVNSPSATSNSTFLVVVALATCVSVLVIVLCLVLWFSFGGEKSAKGTAKGSSPDNPVARAEDLCRQQQWAAAAEIYAKLLGESAPDSPKYQDVLTRIRTPERLSVLPYLGERLPKDTQIQGLVGMYHYEQKEYAKAFAIFEGLTNRPAPEHMHCQLRAMCEVHFGRWDDATTSMERAMTANPGCIPCRTSLAMLAAFGRRKSLYNSQCQELLNRLNLVTDPSHFALIGLAATQAEQPKEQLERIRETVDRSVEQDKTSCPMLVTQGLLRYRLGEYAMALESLQEAERYQSGWSGSPILKPAKVLVLLRLDRKEEARNAFRELTDWRANTQRAMNNDDKSYLANCWHTVVMENLFREAEEHLRR